ncbi:hypothetical protein V6N12_006106 [Hibiscus sabdariffa]|uniref:F-box domain-containing protein n=1 Tax=Hibiscus sabdariffa TaxID=183260 RepID=A0ABR2EXD3_9ROSI
MTRKWQKIAAIVRKRIASTMSNKNIAAAYHSNQSSVVDKGCFVIYTTDKIRFVIPLAFLGNCIFRELFKMSEEEFGLPSDGPITLPCDSVVMNYIFSLMKRGLAKDMERAVLNSIKTYHCSSDTRFNQVHANAKFFHRANMEIAETISSGLPHDALFIVLAYLPLFELLSMSGVCRSLRDAVENDVLPWLNIIVEKPLNFWLSDEILMKISCKANGRLRTLALRCCDKITDDGLQRVIDQNPLISKLYIPGCTGLTPNGVITAVQKLSCGRHGLKSLWLNGIANMKKEHLERIRYYLQTNPKLQRIQPKRQPVLYHNYKRLQAYRWEEHGRAIDVEICPKCNQVQVVFDCPREDCKRKQEDSMTGCRMCMFCVPRCEECGKCVENEDLEETVCGDTLCSDCWIQLSKCNFCNKPCCSQHSNMQIILTSSIGWICSVCHYEYDDFE